MSNIDYTFRLNKQVERKIIIDILSQLKNELNISNYSYVGMGAIYFYDFILIHKAFGIKKQISIENRKDTKRFLYNKPYDFISFKNMLSTDYLMKEHIWSDKSIVWLDYETSFVTEGNEFVESDLKILGKNCRKNDIVFFTINASSPPEEGDYRKAFLEKHKKYISPELFNLKSTTRKNFSLLIQNIWVNILKESSEYNDFKFNKICSFKYKDGAEMYTLGGIFTDDETQLNKILSLHPCLNPSVAHIQNIQTPNITSKEKGYLNAFINALGQNNHKEEIPFELSEDEIKNYIQNYRYIPSYHEGLI